jgi:hypothetical protein
MKNQNVIVFNGEDIIPIDLNFFFQDPKIEGLKPVQIVELYQSTAVFANLLDGMKDLIERGAIKSINEEYLKPGFIEAVCQGLYILEGMVMDLFGDQEGMNIINATNQDIQDAVTP